MLIFVDHPLVQLTPLLLLTAVSIIFLILVRPFDTALMNVFTIVVEALYFMVFVGMLILRLTPKSISLEVRYKYIGLTMIVIICLILGAFIILGIY